MSVETAQAPVTTLPVEEKPVTVEEVAAGSLVSGTPGPVILEAENTPPVEAKTTTTIKTEQAKDSPKRSPFAQLGNVLKSKKNEKKEDKKEEAVVAKEDSAPVLPETATVAETEAAPVEAPATQVADTEAPAVTETAPVVEEEKVAEPSSPKAKSPGVFDKLKSFFGDKKEKSPKKSGEEVKPTETATEETVAPATESAQPEAIAMPAQTEEVSPAGTSAAPTEAAKVEEPVVSTSTAEPTPASDIKTDAEVAQAIVDAPVSTEATSDSAPVAEETKPEVKATEVDAKAEEKKKAKLGRRLSARMFGLISPKKEKTENPLEKAVEKNEKKEEVKEDKKEEAVVAPATTVAEPESSSAPLTDAHVSSTADKPEEVVLPPVASSEPAASESIPAVVSTPAVVEPTPTPVETKVDEPAAAPVDTKTDA